jgi:hypothetical protein
MKDTERLDKLEALAMRYHRAMFDEPIGFIVSDDGTVLSGCLGSPEQYGYPYESLREAIDAVDKESK